MTNRFYTSDKTKWVGRSHIGPGMGNNYAKLISHFIFDGPQVSALGKAYSDVLNAVDDLRQQRETITATGKYMPLGITEAVAKHASEDNIPKLRRAKAAVEKVKAEIAGRVSMLTPARPDPADAIGENQRAELRQRLAGMSAAERSAFLNKHRNDPALVAAVIHASPLLSGIDNLTHRNMVHEQVQREHGEPLAELSDLEEVVRVAERVVSLGRDELREIIGVDRDTFEQIASVSERNDGRLPFKVEREVINGQTVEIARVMDLETKSWRRASPEEIAASRQEAA